MSNGTLGKRGAIAAVGAVLGILSYGQSAIAASLSYTVTDLGAFDIYGSSASDINETGQIVGWAGFPRSAISFLWENGVLQDIGFFPNPEPENISVRGSFATSINDAGQIVGGAVIVNHALPGAVFARAFLWEQNQGFQDLGALEVMVPPGPGPSLSDSFAYDINNLTQVVGSSLVSVLSQLTYHAFLWENGVMQDLGIPGSANAINDLGQIVGTHTTFPEPNRAFFWENGIIQDLGLGSASDINELSQVIGNTSCGNDFCAFLWENGVRQELGMFSAAAINNQGQIVGSSNGGFLDSFALLWDDGMLTDLNTLIDPDLGWLLSSASSINEKGQIVGNGINPDGERRAFLLTPQSVPEPNLVAGLGILAAGLTLNSRKRGKLTSKDQTF
jgi:probable HAF family extracellular repeat protein